VYEGYSESIAAGYEFSYTFSDSVSFGNEGVYKVYAWAELTDNLSSDTVEAEVTVTVILPPVIDLRVTAISGLPPSIVINEGEVSTVAVTISVKNDGDTLIPSAAGFGYKIVKNSQEIRSVYEGYTKGIAANNAFNYVFYNSVSFSDEGVYKVYAWTQVEDNLHNDTVEAEVTVTFTAVAPVVDLRVTAVSVVPANIEIREGRTVTVPVTVSVRNDGSLLPPLAAGFGYKVINGSGNVVKSVFETFSEGITAGGTLNYTFSDSIAFGETGIYKVLSWTKVSGNIHHDTAETEVVATFVTGNQTLSSAAKVGVYPNPSNGNFTVNTAERVTMEIISANGVMLERRDVSGVSEFSLRTKGLYLLRFIDEKGRTSTQRLIVK
jgi:hypothetical protein